MGLKADIKRAAKAAFDAFDDIPQAITYHSISGAVVRDLDAGTSSKPKTDYPIKKAFFLKFTEKDIERYPGILMTDSKVLFLQEEMSATPKEEDQLTDEDGKVWRVGKYMTDPTKTVVILAVRT